MTLKTWWFLNRSGTVTNGTPLAVLRKYEDEQQNVQRCF